MALFFRDYKCNSCGKISEFFLPNYLKEKDLVCPKCGNIGNFESVVSAPGMVKTQFADKTGFKNRKIEN